MTVENSGMAGPGSQEFMFEFPDESALYAPPMPVEGGVESALRTIGATQHARGIGRIVANEFRATIQSLRESGAPRTVSHALLFRDGQSIEEIQARMEDADELDIDNILTALVKVNFVKRYEEDEVIRYRIDPPTEL